MPGSTNDPEAGDGHDNSDREVCTFICPQCDSKFSRLAHLRRHEMTRKSSGLDVLCWLSTSVTSTDSRCFLSLPQTAARNHTIVYTVLSRRHERTSLSAIPGTSTQGLPAPMPRQVCLRAAIEQNEGEPLPRRRLRASCHLLLSTACRGHHLCVDQWETNKNLTQETTSRR